MAPHFSILGSQALPRVLAFVTLHALGRRGDCTQIGFAPAAVAELHLAVNSGGEKAWAWEQLAFVT